MRRPHRSGVRPDGQGDAHLPRGVRCEARDGRLARDGRRRRQLRGEPADRRAHLQGALRHLLRNSENVRRILNFILTVRRNLGKHRITQHDADLKTGAVELAVTGSAFKILQLMGKAQDLLYSMRVFARVKPEGKVCSIYGESLRRFILCVFYICVPSCSARSFL